MRALINPFSKGRLLYEKEKKNTGGICKIKGK